MVLIILFTFNPQRNNISVKADEPPTEPTTTVIDYHNGTICTIIDYGNGTQDISIETTIEQSAMLREDNNQSIPLVLHNEEGQALGTKGFAMSTESTHTTETSTEVINQEILTRWGYSFLKGRWNVTLDAWVAYVKIGLVVDIEFGMRLPVNITVEYDSPVQFDKSNTTMYATITPIDKPNFNESLFIFKSYLFVECGGWLIGGPYTWTYGPNYDLSQSFKTPLGEAIAFPIPPIPAFSIAEFNIPILGTFLEIDLGMQPGFGSKKITARMSATGDSLAVEGTNILWSYPNQTIPFVVKFGDYDPSVDWALIRLYDFQYYFTQFYVRFWLMFDFGSWIDWVLHDFNIPLLTIDMSWLIKNQNWHIGSPQSIDLWFREPAAVHDIAITDVLPSTFKCYPGDIVNVTVLVENKGTSPEAFNVSLFYDTHLIAKTQMSQIMENKTSRALQFEWDTTGIPMGNYTIKAEASLVPEEIDVTNNNMTDGVVTVALCKLSVIVVDGLNSPIQNAVVEVVGQQQANTNIDGEAEFSLAKGYYQVKASKGVLNNSISLNLVADTVVRISLMPPPYGPTAKLTVSPETVVVDKSVRLDASASQPGYNGTHTMPISEYRWDFGDGNKTTTITPIVYHSFHNPGMYYVTLTVYAPGASPETDSTSGRVLVISIPVGGYSVSIGVFVVDRRSSQNPLMSYLAVTALLALGFTVIKRKAVRKKYPHRQDL